MAWHTVDAHTLNSEGAIEVAGRHVFRLRRRAEIIVQCHGSKEDARVDFIYHPDTDFEARGMQKWLRELLRDIIYSVAGEVLPKRVRYWEDEKGLHGSGVKIERLKKNVLACCTSSNEIMLQPFLILFKTEWLDEVILHEMAHYRFKHHRKSFWTYLSSLLGYDAKQAKARKDIELSPYYGYCLYLTKK